MELESLAVPVQKKKRRGPRSKKEGKTVSAANRMFNRHVTNARKLDEQGKVALDDEAKEFLKKYESAHCVTVFRGRTSILTRRKRQVGGGGRRRREEEEDEEGG